jgi:tetratricopeptide (TPR) repeat protein
MMNIGNIHDSKGDSDGTLRYYLDSQKIFDRLRLQNTAAYARLLFNIGRLYEKQRNTEMAARYYRDAYDSFVRAGYVGPEKDVSFSNAQRLGY